jgi:hypothetical protein
LGFLGLVLSERSPTWQCLTVSRYRILERNATICTLVMNGDLGDPYRFPRNTHIKISTKVSPLAALKRENVILIVRLALDGLRPRELQPSSFAEVHSIFLRLDA